MRAHASRVQVCKTWRTKRITIGLKASRERTFSAGNGLRLSIFSRSRWAKAFAFPVPSNNWHAATPACHSCIAPEHAVVGKGHGGISVCAAVDVTTMDALRKTNRTLIDRKDERLVEISVTKQYDKLTRAIKRKRTR